MELDGEALSPKPLNKYRGSRCDVLLFISFLCPVIINSVIMMCPCSTYQHYYSKLGRFDLKSESIEQKYFVMTPRSYQTGITLANQVHKKLK